MFIIKPYLCTWHLIFTAPAGVGGGGGEDKERERKEGKEERKNKNKKEWNNIYWYNFVKQIIPKYNQINLKETWHIHLRMHPLQLICERMKRPHFFSWGTHIFRNSQKTRRKCILNECTVQHLHYCRRYKATGQLET